MGDGLFISCSLCPIPPWPLSYCTEETITGTLLAVEMVENLKPESLASMAQKVSNRVILAERLVTRGKEDNSKLVKKTPRFELF